MKGGVSLASTARATAYRTDALTLKWNGRDRPNPLCTSQAGLPGGSVVKNLPASAGDLV